MSKRAAEADGGRPPLRVFKVPLSRVLIEAIESAAEYDGSPSPQQWIEDVLTYNAIKIKRPLK